MTIRLYSIATVVCLYACGGKENRVSIEQPAGGSLANDPSEESVIVNFTVSENFKKKVDLKIYVTVYDESPAKGVTFAISKPDSFDVQTSLVSSSKARISFLYLEDDSIKGYTTGLSDSRCADLELSLINQTTELVPSMFCEMKPNVPPLK